MHTVWVKEQDTGFRHYSNLQFDSSLPSRDEMGVWHHSTVRFAPSTHGEKNPVFTASSFRHLIDFRDMVKRAAWAFDLTEAWRFTELSPLSLQANRARKRGKKGLFFHDRQVKCPCSQQRREQGAAVAHIYSDMRRRFSCSLASSTLI